MRRGQQAEPCASLGLSDYLQRRLLRCLSAWAHSGEDGPVIVSFPSAPRGRRSLPWFKAIALTLLPCSRCAAGRGYLSSSISLNFEADFSPEPCLHTGPKRLFRGQLCVRRLPG